MPVNLLEGGRVLSLPPNDALPPPGNREVTPEGVTDLVESLRAVGQLQAGVVCPHPSIEGKWYVLAGNRRAAACRWLGVPFKAVAVDRVATEAEIIECRLSENVVRRGLSPLEQAADVAAWLKATGQTQSDAARKFGMSPATVSKLLALLDSPPEVKPLLEAGRIGPDVARLIGSLPSGEDRARLARRAAEEGLTRDAVESVVAGLAGTGRGRPGKRRRIAEGGAEISFPADWGPARVAEFLSGLARRAKSGAL